MRRAFALGALLFAGCAHMSVAADMAVQATPLVTRNEISTPKTIKGEVAVIDGRTLWFPSLHVLVRLAGIESCELPQWSFDPRATIPPDPTLAPLPCGALARAWLIRVIGARPVTCTPRPSPDTNATSAICKIASRDIGLDMLRAGWARTSDPGSSVTYRAAQAHAMAARYGLWSGYVLDMAEWRDKAIDRTLGRRPQADLGLLSERRSEISPPFYDARHQPRRRDR